MKNALLYTILLGILLQGCGMLLFQIHKSKLYKTAFSRNTKTQILTISQESFNTHIAYWIQLDELMYEGKEYDCKSIFKQGTSYKIAAVMDEEEHSLVENTKKHNQQKKYQSEFHSILFCSPLPITLERLFLANMANIQQSIYKGYNDDYLCIIDIPPPECM